MKTILIPATTIYMTSIIINVPCNRLAKASYIQLEKFLSFYEHTEPHARIQLAKICKEISCPASLRSSNLTTYELEFLKDTARTLKSFMTPSRFYDLNALKPPKQPLKSLLGKNLRKLLPPYLKNPLTNF